MSVYVIAQLKFTDRAKYDRYQARFMSVFKDYKGRVLAADEHPRIVEGASDRERIVLLEFPDADAFQEWMDSEAYQEIARDRRAGADTQVFLVEGLRRP